MVIATMSFQSLVRNPIIIIIDEELFLQYFSELLKRSPPRCYIHGDILNKYDDKMACCSCRKRVKSEHINRSYENKEASCINPFDIYCDDTRVITDRPLSVNMSSRFSSKREANASKLLENLEDMFTQYNIQKGQNSKYV